MKIKFDVIKSPAILLHTLFAQTVTYKKERTSFVLISTTQPIAIYVDAQNDWLVQKTATLLRNDPYLVT